MQPAVLISIIVVAVLVVLFVLYLVATRSSLIALRTRVDEAWSDITAQQHRRAELIPQLVDTVRGSGAPETAVYESVAGARAETLAATSPNEATVAENHMQQALRGVVAVAETYPKLHASQRYLQLQGELADIEDHLQTSRRFYNGGVRELNTKIKVFPSSLFARRLGFSSREFFEVTDSAAIAQPPRVQF